MDYRASLLDERPVVKQQADKPIYRPLELTAQVCLLMLTVCTLTEYIQWIPLG